MSDLFHRRPRLLVLALALILVTGSAAFVLLPRAEDPTLKGRAARVVTRLPGASPERVEALVSDKLEEELLEVPEVRLLRSESRAGISIIVIELADAVDEPEPVWTRVRDKLDDVIPALPRQASKPDFDELDITAYTVIAALAWTERRPVDYGALGRLAAGLRDALRTVPGTEDVDLFGRTREEIRVEVDPATLTSLGRSSSDLSREIARSDAKVSAGVLRGGTDDLLVEVRGELDSVRRVGLLPVRQGEDGRVVRLRDIARIEKTVADPAQELALVSGRPAVTVAARMTTGLRVDHWTAQVKTRLSAYEKTLPQGVALQVVFDQSEYTSERLDSLTQNLLLGVALVMVVMLFAMGWRSALLVGLSLPLASLMVLAGMRALDIPIHQMSITGLIIALGLLIDNAIVMVDEVEERLRDGAGAGAAISGAVRHLSVPLLGSTLTTALAFMPMVLMPGPAGEFVGAIGTTVILALASSLLLSLTIIPTLRGLLAERSHDGAVPAAGGRWWHSGLGSARLTERYRGFLDAVLRRPALAALVAAAIPLAGFAAGSRLEEQFFPPADRDQFQVELRLPSQASLALTRDYAERARGLILARPEVRDVHWFVGKTAPKFYYNMLAGQDGASFYAQALVQLRSSRGSRRVINELQRELDRALPAAQSVVKLLEQGPPFEAPVEVHLFGPDLSQLRRLGDQLRGILARTPHVVQTRSSLRDGRPKLWLDLDEEEARLAGMNNVEVARQLDAALGGALGGSVLEGSEELPVRVRVTRPARTVLAGVESLGVFAPPGADGVRRSVPVTALGDVRLVPQLATVTRRNGRRVNTVQGFLRAGVLPSRALTAFQAELETSGFQLPPGYRLEVGGESKERDRAVGNLLASAGVLLVLMAATLVLAFNSFRQAGIIAMVGGLAIGLSLTALWVFGSPFGFMAIVGTMGLIGVAINDAIVVLAAIREDPRASQGDPEAIRDVVLRSTRHVVATTLTTVAGFVPLIVMGGDFWRPLAVAVAGGVAGATVLALTFVPAAFLVLVRLGMTCPLRGCLEATSPSPAGTPGHRTRPRPRSGAARPGSASGSGPRPWGGRGGGP